MMPLARTSRKAISGETSVGAHINTENKRKRPVSVATMNNYFETLE